MEMSVLSILWYFLIFLLIGGYFVLDGFDLGVGVLYPFLSNDQKDEVIMRRSIGPVWDGNEVWILTAGGALFAAFPDAYATTFSGFYLAIMLVLFGLIVRAVSFEFWAADRKWRPLWNVCFFLGSLIPALLYGVAVGNVIYGIPMDAYGNYIGIPLLGLINPFTLLCGLVGLSMMITAGACWLSLKAPLNSELAARAMKVRMPMQLISLGLFIITTIYMFVAMSGSMEMAPELGFARWFFAALFVVAIIVAIFFNGSQERGALWSFLCQSLAACSLVFLVACSMFPVLVMASPDSIGGPVTIASAGSSELSLLCMTIILCIGLPLVLLYHFIIYRTFRGRISEADLSH